MEISVNIHEPFVTTAWFKDLEPLTMDFKDSVLLSLLKEQTGKAKIVPAVNSSSFNFRVDLNDLQNESLLNKLNLALSENNNDEVKRLLASYTKHMLAVNVLCEILQSNLNNGANIVDGFPELKGFESFVVSSKLDVILFEFLPEKNRINFQVLLQIKAEVNE